MIKRKKALPAILIATLMMTTASFATPNKDMQKLEKVFLNRVNENRAMNHIEVLSEDIGVRVSGTKEEYEAAKYIEKQFKSMGYKTEIQEFKFVRGGQEVTSWNVIATMKPGVKGIKNDKNDTNKIVHLTAHYDSVPKAPGANDNASGVASMLEIAKSMTSMDIDKEVRFVACGSEEVGLKGSYAYVDSLTEDEINRSEGNFNLDMVATAYEPCSELAVYTYNQGENVITDYMKKAGEKISYLSNDEVEYNGEYDGPMGSSDHVPFAKKGIPSALVINVDPAKKDDPRSAIEPYYHKPEDHTGNVSVDRLERTVKLVGLATLDALNVD